MFETIVALATPPVKSALAIVRLSGDNCFEIVSKSFSKDITNEKSRGIHHGFLFDNNKNKIDEVIVLVYVAPHSFTGENSVEIITHGSMVIVDQIITALLSNGARMATNGEFSSRAFMLGKIDLIQAEAINDMINAESIESKNISMQALSGETSKVYAPIEKRLNDLLSNIEVNIDYPEFKDIEEVTTEKIIKETEAIISSIEDLLRNSKKAKVIKDGVNVAIVGEPNVGKSSLLNALIDQDKAIVTDIAGTTRDIVEGDCFINGVKIHLIDTAGYHESQDIIEKIGIKKTEEAIENCDLVLRVFDNDIDNSKINEIIKNKKVINVQNKGDLHGKTSQNAIKISALNKNIQPLKDEIIKVLGIENVDIKPSFNNQRQIGLLIQMIEALKNANNDAKNGLSLDIVSVNLMVAYNLSLDLMGKSNRNDLTQEIFSRFCVGK